MRIDDKILPFSLFMVLLFAVILYILIILDIPKDYKVIISLAGFGILMLRHLNTSENK